jgi:hypothetical protein
VRAVVQPLADALLTADTLRVEIEANDVGSTGRIKAEQLAKLREAIAQAHHDGIREATMPTTTLDVLSAAIAGRYALLDTLASAAADDVDERPARVPGIYQLETAPLEPTRDPAEIVRRTLDRPGAGDDQYRMAQRIIEALRDAGCTVMPPPCPGCHGNGFVTKGASGGDSANGTGWGSAWNEPCPRGCPAPQAFA